MPLWYLRLLAVGSLRNALPIANPPSLSSCVTIHWISCTSVRKQQSIVFLLVLEWLSLLWTDVVAYTRVAVWLRVSLVPSPTSGRHFIGRLIKMWLGLHETGWSRPWECEYVSPAFCETEPSTTTDSDVSPQRTTNCSQKMLGCVVRTTVVIFRRRGQRTWHGRRSLEISWWPPCTRQRVEHDVAVVHA